MKERNKFMNEKPNLTNMNNPKNENIEYLYPVSMGSGLLVLPLLVIIPVFLIFPGIMISLYFLRKLKKYKLNTQTDIESMRIIKRKMIMYVILGLIPIVVVVSIIIYIFSRLGFYGF